jgi:hypothetical protein
LAEYKGKLIQFFLQGKLILPIDNFSKRSPPLQKYNKGCMSPYPHKQKQRQPLACSSACHLLQNAAFSLPLGVVGGIGIQVVVIIVNKPS